MNLPTKAYNMSANERVNIRKSKLRLITTILISVSCVSITACNSGTEKSLSSIAGQNKAYSISNGMITYNPKEIEEKRNRRKEKYDVLKPDILHPDSHETHSVQTQIDGVLNEVHSEYWTSFHGMGGRIIMLDSNTDLSKYLKDKGVPLDDLDSVTNIYGEKISLNEHNIYINNNSADGKPEIYVKDGGLSYEANKQYNILFAIYHDHMQKYRKFSLPGSPVILPFKFDQLISQLNPATEQTNNILATDYFTGLDKLKSSIQGHFIDWEEPQTADELAQLYARLLAYNAVYEKNSDSTLKDLWPKMANYLSKEAKLVYTLRRVSGEENILNKKIFLRVSDGDSISENDRPKVDQSKKNLLRHIKDLSSFTLLLNALYKPSTLSIEANKVNFLDKYSDKLELGMSGKPVTAIYAEKNDSGTIQHIYTHADVDYTDTRELKDIYYIMIKQQLQLTQPDYDSDYIKLLNNIPTQAETFLTKSEIDSAKKLTLNQLETDPKALEIAHSIFAKMLVHHLYEPYNVFTKWPDMARYTTKGVANLFYIDSAKDFLIGRADGVSISDTRKYRGIFDSTVNLRLEKSTHLSEGSYKTVIADSRVDLSSRPGGGRDFDIPPMIIRDSVLSTGGIQWGVNVDFSDVSMQNCAFLGRADTIYGQGVNLASIKLYFPNSKDGHIWLNDEDFLDNITNLNNSYISFIDSLNDPSQRDARVNLINQVIDWSRNNLHQISYNGLISLLALLEGDDLPTVSDFRTQLITELATRHRGSEGSRYFSDAMKVVRSQPDEFFNQNRIIGDLLNNFLNGSVSVEDSEAINTLLFEIRHNGRSYNNDIKELASQLSKKYFGLPEIEKFVEYLEGTLSLDISNYQLFVTTAPEQVPVDPLDIRNEGEMKAAPLANKRIALALDKVAMERLLLRNDNGKIIDIRGIAFTIDGEEPSNPPGMVPQVMDSYPLVRPGYSEYKSGTVIHDIIKEYELPGNEYANFTDAIYSKASTVKYITKQTDHLLANTFDKYVTSTLLEINRDVQITPEHQQSILNKYHNLTRSNPKREAQVLIGMAAIFANLSSKVFFGTDTATSFPLRLMSLAYFNAALSRDPQLNINTDYIRNALTGIKPNTAPPDKPSNEALFAQTCTALVAEAMEKTLRRDSPDIYRKVIPLAWQ
jgi:hypothetical protein